MLFSNVAKTLSYALPHLPRWVRSLNIEIYRLVDVIIVANIEDSI